ncbi:hypothetical protein HK096_008719, partial [Nowakowskiella sp. JEL0078]
MDSKTGSVSNSTPSTISLQNSTYPSDSTITAIGNSTYPSDPTITLTFEPEGSIKVMSTNTPEAPRPETSETYMGQQFRSLNRHHSLASESSNYSAWLRNGGDLPLYPGTPSMTPEPPDYNEVLRASMLVDGATGALVVPRSDLGRSSSTRSVVSVLRNDRLSREVGGSLGRPVERSSQIQELVERPMEIASSELGEIGA